MLVPVICSVRHLKNNILAAGGIHPAPTGTEVFRLEVTEVEEISDILGLSFIMFGRTFVVVLEKLVGLVEMMIDSHVKSVPGIEVHHRT